MTPAFRGRRKAAGLVMLVCLVAGGCSGIEEDPPASGGSAAPRSPSPTRALSASPSPSQPAATDAVSTDCLRRTSKVVDRVSSWYHRRPEHSSASGVRETIVRLADQLRNLEAERVCPAMPVQLAAFLDDVDPPHSLSELEGFSAAYAAWALSAGLRRDRHRFLEDPVWCLRHADQYVLASAARRSQPASGGFRVWVDVSFENLTDRVMRGFRVGSLTVLDPEGLRRLRSYDGHRVNRMVAGSWGGGTDGPVTLPARERTTMVMGDALNQPLVLPFEPVLKINGTAVVANVDSEHSCTYVARLS